MIMIMNHDALPDDIQNQQCDPLSLSPVAVLFAQGEAPPPEAGEAAVSPTCIH